MFIVIVDYQDTECYGPFETLEEAQEYESQLVAYLNSEDPDVGWLDWVSVEAVLPGFIPPSALQAARLAVDPRLSEPCAACEHPGYEHQNAEAQYATDTWGVPIYEAGVIECEHSGCSCGWYEGENWQLAKGATA